MTLGESAGQQTAHPEEMMSLVRHYFDCYFEFLVWTGEASKNYFYFQFMTLNAQRINFPRFFTHVESPEIAFS